MDENPVTVILEFSDGTPIPRSTELFKAVQPKAEEALRKSFWGQVVDVRLRKKGTGEELTLVSAQMSGMASALARTKVLACLQSAGLNVVADQ